MNNSKLVLDIIEDQPEDITERLRIEESKLIRIIDALQVLEKTKEWSTLKTELFDNLALVLEKDIKNEARKDDPNPKKLNRLSGELKWAERYADLSKLAQNYRVQLQGIRKHNGNQE